MERCRVWLKRFNGVAFTGGMRFASDVTLERGLTRLFPDPAALPGEGLGGQPIPPGHRAVLPAQRVAAVS